MQPYRTDATGRKLCQAPDCDQPAASQVLRHATAAEYDALPPGLVPIDGIAHKAVFGCETHAQAFTPLGTHPHRENCEVFTGCQCTPDDPNPPRTPRTQAARETVNACRLRIPVAVAKTLVMAHDIPWHTVRALDSRQTQDNRPAIGVEHARIDGDGQVLDDGHGHEIIDTAVIPLVHRPRAQALPPGR
jgi:transposase